MPNAECQMKCRVPSAECRRADADAARADRASSFGIRHSALGTHAPAFTFIEVLFAIIILGIGMIMIAGMLPVAIKQNSDTRDDLIGRATAQAGYSYIRAAIQQDPDAFTVSTTNANGIGELGAYDGIGGPNDATIGRVVPLNQWYLTNNGTNAPRTMLLTGLQASRINSSDPTFQWLGFYRRDVNASQIHVIVLAMRLRNTDPVDRYSVTPGKLTLDDKGWNAGNGPFSVTCKIEDGGALDPDRIIFTGGDQIDTKIAGPGAFVIVNHASVNSSRNNGRVFQLGQQRLDVDPAGRTWDLVPGYDLPPAGPGNDLVIGTDDDTPDTSMNPDATSSPGKEVTAWMVGRGHLDPANAIDPTDAFGGLPQDVSVLQVDVPLN